MASEATGSPQRKGSVLIDAAEIAQDAAELWRLSKDAKRPSVKEALLRLYADIGARLAEAQQVSVMESPPATARKRKQVQDSPSSSSSEVAVKREHTVVPGSPVVTSMPVAEGPKETPKSARRATTARAAIVASQLTPLTKKVRDAQRKARKRAAQEFLINFATLTLSEKERERELASFCTDELKKASLRSLVTGVMRNDGDFKWLLVRGEGLKNAVIEAAKHLIRNPSLSVSFTTRRTPVVSPGSRARGSGGDRSARGENESEEADASLDRARTGVNSLVAAAAAAAAAQLYDEEGSVSGAESENDMVEFRSDFAHHEESEEDEGEEEEDEEEEEEDEDDRAKEHPSPQQSRPIHRSLVYSSPIQSK